MTSYNKKLIKQDLINIINWTKDINWKELKKQLYTIIKTNYNTIYSSNKLKSNYNIYISISRLSQILKSDELFLLIKDLNKYYYNKDKHHNLLIGGNYETNILQGGVNFGSFAKLASFASSAKKMHKR